MTPELPLIGVDLGGTKIEAIALEPDGNTRGRIRVPTPRDDYSGTLDAIGGLVATLERDLGSMASVGVGTPGAVSPATGRIKNANSIWLNGQSLIVDLERLLKRRVVVANDADCFALSEATDGAGQGAEVVFGVILGTGVGGGLVVRGRPVSGPNAICGEWGHNPLPWPGTDELPGPDCYCQRSGCIETYLSGPGLAADHRSATGKLHSPREIALLASQGNPDAVGTMERYSDRLARGLATLINSLDPDVIVLGGGISNIGSLYETVPSRWSSYVFSDQVDTRLAPARHGDSSGVRGAAWLGRAGTGGTRLR